jgi:hypothetical protein
VNPSRVSVVLEVRIFVGRWWNSNLSALVRRNRQCRSPGEIWFSFDDEAIKQLVSEPFGHHFRSLESSLTITDGVSVESSWPSILHTTVESRL